MLVLVRKRKAVVSCSCREGLLAGHGRLLDMRVGRPLVMLRRRLVLPCLLRCSRGRSVLAPEWHVLVSLSMYVDTGRTPMHAPMRRLLEGDLMHCLLKLLLLVGLVSSLIRSSR